VYMRLIADDEILSLLPDTLGHIFLLRIVDESDDLRRPLT